MHKKGQAALEFLTTYGWAFLVILVMIGALAYFGVLNPSRFVPETCTFGSTFQCDDAMLVGGKTGSVTLKLKNNIEPITIISINVTDVDSGEEYTAAPAVSIGAGEVFYAEVTGIDDVWNIGDKKKLSIDIYYYKTNSGPTYTNTIGGDVVGTVS